MTSRPAIATSEGLRAARFLMVLSSISPLFILWAIRGNDLVPERYFVGFCLLMVVIPNVFLWLRIRTAKKQSDKRVIVAGNVDDHRDHILVYLFAMLLPFYSESIETWRDLGATIGALSFIMFLFWHLNLHYMNIIFATRGYRVFTIYSPDDDNLFTGKTGQVLLTRRVNPLPGDQIVAYRLSDTVALEVEE